MKLLYILSPMATIAMGLLAYWCGRKRDCRRWYWLILACVIWIAIALTVGQIKI